MANVYYHRLAALTPAVRLPHHQVSSSREIDTLSYQQQGDALLSTIGAFRQRQKLRRDPEVLKELDLWWEAALITARKVRPGAATLSKEDYVIIYIELYVDLIGDDEDDGPEERADAEFEAQEEWDKDSFQGEMQRNVFLDAIFELVDLYETEISGSSSYSRLPMMCMLILS